MKPLPARLPNSRPLCVSPLPNPAQIQAGMFSPAPQTGFNNWGVFPLPVPLFSTGVGSRTHSRGPLDLLLTKGRPGSPAPSFFACPCCTVYPENRNLNMAPPTKSGTPQSLAEASFSLVGVRLPESPALRPIPGRFNYGFPPTDAAFPGPAGSWNRGVAAVFGRPPGPPLPFWSPRSPERKFF